MKHKAAIVITIAFTASSSVSGEDRQLYWTDLTQVQQSNADYCYKNTKHTREMCMEISNRHETEADFMRAIKSDVKEYSAKVKRDWDEINRVKNAEKIEAKKLAKKPGVKIGVTALYVINESSWGKPARINRTTTSTGTNEQWIYGGGNYLYFRNGILYAIQN